MEIVILAGGFGTRLQSRIHEVAKPMAPIRGKPFLEHLLSRISKNTLSHIILCTGYKHESIETYFGSSFNAIPLTYSVEHEPLGTGGAILQALQYIHDDHCIILNGDTLFDIDLSDFYQKHVSLDSDFTLALKSMNSFDRYGTVKRLNDRIVSFEEKKYHAQGEINAGVYCIKKRIFSSFQFSNKFSLEKDLLEKHINDITINGIVFDGYFIDIGIPEDYDRAQRDFM